MHYDPENKKVKDLGVPFSFVELTVSLALRVGLCPIGFLDFLPPGLKELQAYDGDVLGGQQTVNREMP